MSEKAIMSRLLSTQQPRREHEPHTIHSAETRAVESAPSHRAGDREVRAHTAASPRARPRALPSFSLTRADVLPALRHGVTSSPSRSLSGRKSAAETSRLSASAPIVG